MEPQLSVNGLARRLGTVGGHVTLLDWLRAEGLTGSKEGCAEGECGACAVLVSRPDGEHQSRWTAINACLMPAAGFDGQVVVTAEGLGAPDALHPVQREMANRGGSQCGYCTPGFVCAMAGEYYRPDRTPTGRTERSAAAEPGTDGEAAARGGNGQVDPTRPGNAPDHEHGANGFDLHALSGNLCRCTGYRPIRDAAYALELPDHADPLRARCEQPAPAPVATRINSEYGSFVRPLTLAEALDLLADHPDAQLVAGSTDWGVEINLRHARTGLSIGLDRLDELRGLTETETGIDIGAALTLSEIERGLAGRVPMLDELFPQFASRLIRNGATLGGNLATASPIGDATSALLALGCTLVLASRDGEREVALADFFTGYRQTLLRPDELITIIRVPTPVAPIAAFHKIAKRRFDDISSVAVAYALRLADGVVESVMIGLGGVAATPIRARNTELALAGRPWSRATVRAAAEVLAREGTPLSDHRASAAYRTAMLRTSLLKLHTSNPVRGREVQVNDFRVRPAGRPADQPQGRSGDPARERGPTRHRNRPLHRGPRRSAPGRAARLAAAGPPCARSCHRAAGRARVRGPRRGQGADRCRRTGGERRGGEERRAAVSAGGDVLRPRGLLGARRDARRRPAGAEAIEVDYEPLPSLISVRDAIAADSFQGARRTLRRGDVDQGLAEATYTFAGELEIGGQEHFYLEGQAALALVDDDGQVFVHSSTQHPSETQTIVAHVLGVDAHAVTVQCRRMGGGFGGKEFQPHGLAAVAALGATITHRPVSLALNRTQDITMTGKRHPFLATWEVGFDADLRLCALRATLTSNGGWSLDLSEPVLARALCHVENAYWIPNIEVHGRIAKTHRPSNTAFRGFGGPQGMIVIEDILGRCAPLLGVEPESLRRRNLYAPGQATPYGQPVRHAERLADIWRILTERSDLTRRQSEVAAFNARNPDTKRGLALTPVKFGISFNLTAFNQAGALVHVYQDGSVLINHGGTEMGQGLHTKMIQVAATALGVPLSFIRLAPTRTDKVPNTSATAASSGADLNGGAIKDACEQIRYPAEHGRGREARRAPRRRPFRRRCGHRDRVRRPADRVGLPDPRRLPDAGAAVGGRLLPDIRAALGCGADAGRAVQVLRVRGGGLRGRGRRLHRRVPAAADRHRARCRRHSVAADRPGTDRGRLRPGGRLADPGGAGLGRGRRPAPGRLPPRRPARTRSRASRRCRRSSTCTSMRRRPSPGWCTGPRR